jgi:hypothetical protein
MAVFVHQNLNSENASNIFAGSTRNGLGSKGLYNIPYKKSKKPPKFLQIAPF